MFVIFFWYSLFHDIYFRYFFSPVFFFFFSQQGYCARQVFFFFTRALPLWPAKGSALWNPQGASPLTPSSNKPQLRFALKIKLITTHMLSDASHVVFAAWQFAHNVSSDLNFFFFDKTVSGGLVFFCWVVLSSFLCAMFTWKCTH